MHPELGVVGGLECFRVFAVRLFDFLFIVCIMKLFSFLQFLLYSYLESITDYVIFFAVHTLLLQTFLNFKIQTKAEHQA